MKKRVIRFILRYSIGYILMGLFLVLSNVFDANKEKKENLKQSFKLSNLPKNKLTDQFNKLINYKDFKDKTILMDFWFAGCSPCRKDMAYFPGLLNTYKDKLVILSYSIDDSTTTSYILNKKPDPFQFIENKNSNWHFFNTNPFDKNSLVNKLKIRSFPTYFIISPNRDYTYDSSDAILDIHHNFGNNFKGLIYLIDKIINDPDNFFWYGTFIYLNFIVIVILFLQLLIFLTRRFILKHQKVKF